MAVSAVAALVGAQLQASWNRLRREAGRGGQLAGAGIAALALLVLGLPATLLARVGWSFGQELRAGDATLLLGWQGLQAGLAVGLGLLAGWRFRPAFAHAALGRFPVRPRDLLLAELPASLLEVFPLLASTGIVATHLGLAAAWPAAAPLVIVLAAVALLVMLSVMALVAAGWRRFARRRVALALFATALAAGLWQLDWESFRAAVRTGVPAVLAALPTSRAYGALLDLRAGRLASAAASLGLALFATAALLAFAAWVHARSVRDAGAESPRRPPRRQAAPSLGRLFHRQLLDTASGRLTLLMPLLVTAPFALVIGLVQGAAARGDVMPEPLVRVAERLAALPWPWLFFAFVAVDSELWLNQFGLDRGGVRTLLQLPLAGERLLAGKLSGLARFSALQVVLGAAPLLLVKPPTAGDLVAGCGMAAFVVLTAGGIGQLFSLRFPRRVEREGGTTLPLQLAWVPLALILPLVGWLAAARALAAGLGPAAVAAAPLAMAVLAAVGYRLALPLLAGQLQRHRERLVSL